MAVDRGAKSKWFPVMVYEEYYQSVFQNLEEYGYQYVACKHDRDKTADGNLKNLHWHFVILLGERDSYQFTIAKQLGLANRFVQRPLCEEPNGAVRYLLHLDNPDKEQYSIKELVTNIDIDRLRLLLTKIDKPTKAEEVECILKDVRRYAIGKMGLRDMLLKHPAFIYQIKSLFALAEVAKFNEDWYGSDMPIDKKSGEFLE